MSLPDEADRYYLMPMLERLDQCVRRPRQADHRRQGANVLPSPARAGREHLPAGVTEYKSPTSMVWILGRTYCTGTPEDYKAVHEFRTNTSSSR